MINYQKWGCILCRPLSVGNSQFVQQTSCRWAVSGDHSNWIIRLEWHSTWNLENTKLFLSPSLPKPSSLFDRNSVILRLKDESIEAVAWHGRLPLLKVFTLKAFSFQCFTWLVSNEPILDLHRSSVWHPNKSEMIMLIVLCEQVLIEYVNLISLWHSNHLQPECSRVDPLKAYAFGSVAF